MVNFNGLVYIEHSTVSSNTPEASAGLFNSLGLIEISDTNDISNTAQGFGGGITLYDGGGIVLERVWVSENQAEFGGGISNSGGILPVTNSTISKNNAIQYGGGLWTDSSTYIASSTITANLARLGGITGGGGGVSVAAIHSGETDIKNTILYGNLQKFQMMFFADDCSGNLTTSHYNLIGTLTSCTLEGSQDLDLIGIDPMLGALQNNGGPTDTHALLDGSPAIDSANPAGCLTYTNFPLSTDQRGYPRPRDGDGDSQLRCDIGAFEYPRYLNMYLPMLRK